MYNDFICDKIRSLIKRKGGHVIVGRNHEVLFEVPFESIDDVTVFDSVYVEFAFTKQSKQLPLDLFNTMLGLGYSMLFNEIMVGVINAGLHPFVGCMHSLKGGHPALVSDLIEDWRAPVIDSLLLIYEKVYSFDYL